MPFAGFAARSFTTASIQKNAPGASGVYGLCNASGWLFIGEGNNLRAQLLEHLGEKSTDSSVQRATGFVFELCSAGERDGRKEKLVRELKPFFNRRG